jgi:diguanylate cyclase (GGDEF)-like protein/PAS domain S-box-containing protein
VGGGQLQARVVYSMVPPAAAALWLLRLNGLIAPTSLWVIGALLGGGTVLTTLADRWYEAQRNRLRLNVRIASQVGVVTATIYLIGWGPMLALGYLFVAQENIAATGSKVWRPAAIWCVGGIACGQVAIATGLVPSFLHEPAVHGLAALVTLGLVFIIRLTGEAAAAKEGAEAEMRESEERFRSLVQNSSDVIVVGDERLHVRYVSGAIERLTGYPPSHYEGRLGFDFLHSDDTREAGMVVADLLTRPGGSVTLEVRVVTSDASWRSIEVTLTNLLEHPSVKGIVANLHDVTERRRLAATLEFGAYHDALTGLANRRAFLDRLEQELARGRRHDTTVAVLFCDLDRFKLVNDSLGHGVGDRLLVVLADRLSVALRPEDLVARFAGDEFAILLSEVTGPNHAVVAAERVLECLRAPVLLEGRELKMTASIGIAFSQPEDEPGDLLREADLAMYQAKGRGRGGWSLFDTEVERLLLERISLEAELWRAAERQELVVLFQPEVDVETGRVVGAEALVRWPHPERGTIMPDDFIPVAEDSDLILTIDRFVLTTACAALLKWRSAGVGESIRMSVNLSAHWFRELERIGQIAELVAMSGLSPADLQLEITERVALGESEETNEALEALRAAGFRIAIDDFGVGYSSLAYLSRFRVDALKLDRSFVARADDSERDAAILRAMVSLGQALGTRIIAEGVERPAQLQLLRTWGCDGAQGFLFSPPVSDKAVLAMLTAEHTVMLEVARQRSALPA